MTAKEIFDEALTLTGYGITELFDSSDISSRALVIVNAVYSDVYFLNHKEGFEKIHSIDDTVNIGERELCDCMIYGIAAMIANILGSENDYKVFSSLYNYKKSLLLKKCEITQIQDTFVKGCDS